jgi:hypothetical protein
MNSFIFVKALAAGGAPAKISCILSCFSTLLWATFETLEIN